MKAKEILTTENASKASTVSNISNPEWGTMSFNHNQQHLFDEKFVSTIGRGAHSRVLYESEYKFWQIESYK